MYIVILCVAAAAAALVWFFVPQASREAALEFIGVLTVILNALLFMWRRCGQLKLTGLRRHLSSPQLPRIVVSFIGLVGLALALASGWRLWADRAEIMTLGWWAHAISAFAALLLLALLIGAFWYNARYRAQWQSIVSLQRMLQENHPWHGVPPGEARTEARESIKAILANLERELDATIPNLFYRLERRLVKHPRLLSIWVPDTDQGAFRCIAWVPREGCYKKLAKNHEPKMYDADGFEEFLKEHGSERPTARKAQETWDEAKSQVSSLMGAIWADVANQANLHPVNGSYILDDVQAHNWEEHYFFDHSHEGYLNDDDNVEIRSFFGRVLSAADEKIGFLLILDPLRSSMYLRDTDLIEAHIHLAEMALKRHLHFSNALGIQPWANV